MRTTALTILLIGTALWPASGLAQVPATTEAAPAVPATNAGAGTAGPTGVTPRASATPNQAATSVAATPPMREMTVAQIVDKDLVGAGGRDLGDIQQVVESIGDKKRLLVVGSGGVLGFFQTQTVLPIDRLRADGEALAVTDLNEDQLKALPTFNESMFREVPRQERIKIAGKI